MELYTKTAALLSKTLTQQYSTSFASASRLFPLTMQTPIYNIYGLVRVADEIVDSYNGLDKAAQLLALEKETHDAIKRGFSVNPIVHSFAVTARAYGITQSLTEPFFASMRMDIDRSSYDQATYQRYIYGSAEVIGLMCLKVFCAAEPSQYDELQLGARRLGAAYQKVNFLRDLAADYHSLGRYYFPGSTFDAFTDDVKQRIVAEINADFEAAEPYIKALPVGARKAVTVSYRYYQALLDALKQTPAETIKQRRIRIPGYRKFILLAGETLRTRP